MEHAARHYPSLLLTEGLSGITRHELEREAYVQKRILMQLKRRKLAEEQELGDKIIYALTLNGEKKLLKQKIRLLNKTAKDSKNKCLVTFDILERGRWSRETLRQFLKECGFALMHKSVWCANEAVIPDLKRVVTELGMQRWIKIVRGEVVL